MDQIKEAFSKVKEDITNLNKEIKDIHKELEEIQRSILFLIKTSSTDKPTDRQTHQNMETSTDTSKFSPSFTQNKTENTSPTHPSTQKYLFQELKSQNISFSTGNRGVPTDRQTNQQTDRHTNSPLKEGIQTTLSSSLISQLDSFKKDLRLKLKRLTNQEMLVFSAIYQFDTLGELVDYPFLSSKLSLSESSIRDYTRRIASKGLPLDKEKINNKRILLHISEDLKKLTTLDTLLKLREM